MPARVLICSSNDVALPDNTANAPTATGACMLADSNVPAATTRLGFRANLDDAILSAIITQMEGLSTTHVAQPLQPVLPAHKATLLSLLPHRDKLSYPSRVIVASDLVDSLAHLAGSPWITPDVTQSDIAFFDGSGGMNPSPRNPTFTKAYLSRELHRPTSGQQLAEEYSSEYYQTIVLTMCIWLLGLCAASDHSRDIDTQQPLLAIMADAISWHEQLCKSETGVILEAALECLRLAMDSRLSFTDRDKDLEDFRVKVMEPLRMGDRAVPLVI
nr:hypothetical protein B0A51_01541 [Rachicladosporium sp. CCFEE 5018]